MLADLSLQGSEPLFLSVDRLWLCTCELFTFLYVVCVCVGAHTIEDGCTQLCAGVLRPEVGDGVFLDHFYLVY